MKTFIQPKTNPVFLNFKKKNIEKDFKNYISKRIKFNHRSGVIASIISWVIASIGIYWGYPEHGKSFIMLALLLLPIFLIVFFTSYDDNKLHISKIFSALANICAFILVLYISLNIIIDPIVLVVGLLVVLLFSYYILRIQYRINIFLSLLEVIIAQFAIIFLTPTLENNIPIVTIALP